MPLSFPCTKQHLRRVTRRLSREHSPLLLTVACRNSPAPPGAALKSTSPPPLGLRLQHGHATICQAWHACRCQRNDAADEVRCKRGSGNAGVRSLSRLIEKDILAGVRDRMLHLVSAQRSSTLREPPPSNMMSYCLSSYVARNACFLCTVPATPASPCTPLHCAACSVTPADVASVL